MQSGNSSAKVSGLFLAACACVDFTMALYMVSVNLIAPFFRDAGMFMFMANNIYHGQAPYWATWDTKNPFVEYFWALCYLPLAPHFGVVGASRIAESIFIAFTGVAFSYFLFTLYERYGRPKTPLERTWGALLSLIAGSWAVFLLSNRHFTDFGLYVTVYQSLPEILSLLIVRALLERRSGFLASLLGLSVFIAWWTKQTSVVSLAPAFLVTLLWAYRTGRFKELARDAALSIVVFAVLCCSFLLSLWRNETLLYYWRGSHQFNMNKVSGGLLAAVSKYCERWSHWADPYNGLVWTTVVFVVASCAFIGQYAWFRRRRREMPMAYPSLLCLAWLGGCLFQCYAPLTFLPNYFLACWAPAVACLFMIVAGTYWLRKLLPPVLLVVSLCLAVMAVDYRHERDALSRINEELPLIKNMPKLTRVVPPDSKVFIWGAFMHYHVMNGKASDYAQNMWLPYIVNSLKPEERDAEMEKNFMGNPPDFFIEMFESYPVEYGLYPTPLNEALLEKWTHCSYSMCFELPRNSSVRLGPRVRVFSKIPIPPNQS